MTNDPNPAEALASIKATRTAVGERMMNVHWSYDLVYGLLCGMIVSAIGLPQPYGILTTAIAIGGLGLMVRAWQKQTGTWVNGFSPPRARWVAIGLGLVMLALMVGGMWLVKTADLWWGSLATGAAAGVIAVIASRLWMRVYRRELAEPGA